MKKKVLIGLLVLFLGFWMVQSPNTLASSVQEGGAWVWEMTTRVFTSVINFLGALGD